MTDRYTKGLLSVIAIASTLLLTSCSGPNSSGGVEMAKSDNSFPHGSCEGSHTQDHSNEKTGCGWINKKFHDYIKPYANLEGAVFDRFNLMFANLANADLGAASLCGTDLSGANLSGASLDGVWANRGTTCPNGIHWGTSGNDCGFVDVVEPTQYGNCGGRLEQPALPQADSLSTNPLANTPQHPLEYPHETTTPLTHTPAPTHLLLQS